MKPNPVNIFQYQQNLDINLKTKICLSKFNDSIHWSVDKHVLDTYNELAI